MISEKTYIGRRKSSVARINIVAGKGLILINNKNMLDYMQNNPKFIQLIEYPLTFLGLEKNYDVLIKVSGGGISGQADAIKLALARNIYSTLDLHNKLTLKKSGLLTCNSLCKERRKYGLKKARKAPQFSKR